MVHARNKFGDEFRAVALEPVFNRAIKRDLPVQDMHFEVGSIDIMIVRQAIANIFANALV